ncbi:MAG: hypothetical protein WCB33_26535, partial [Bradyrhizobium sp.]
TWSDNRSVLLGVIPTEGIVSAQDRHGNAFSVRNQARFIGKSGPHRLLGERRPQGGLIQLSWRSGGLLADATADGGVFVVSEAL